MLAKSLPGSVPVMSRMCPGCVPEVSRKCPGRPQRRPKAPSELAQTASGLGRHRERHQSVITGIPENSDGKQPMDIRNTPHWRQHSIGVSGRGVLADGGLMPGPGRSVGRPVGWLAGRPAGRSTGRFFVVLFCIVVSCCFSVVFACCCYLLCFCCFHTHAVFCMAENHQTCW